jgi:hypothetical protein
MVGFKSTFFFLLTSEFYNPLSNKLQIIFQELHKLGHHIGLHYDPQAYHKNIDQNIVRKILDGEFDIHSTHKPGTYGMEQYDGIQLTWTYQKEFAWDSKYVTDSNRSWKYGEPVQLLDEYLENKDTGRNFQLLIHPIWWNRTILTKEEALNVLVKEYEANLKEQILKDKEDYDRSQPS